ncbi:MAG: nitronate monooxygenase, partial [Salaquimonas sp.]
AKNAPDVLLCAAGGIGDGRGLAASLMLGADGALVGSRFWASRESLAHPNMLKAAIKSDGDNTIRSSVMDIAREIDWPKRYTARVLKNGFTDKWHNDQQALIEEGKIEADKWRAAWAEGNTDIANTFVGEVTGIIHNIRPAGEILEEMVSDAAKLITRSAQTTVVSEA